MLHTRNGKGDAYQLLLGAERVETLPLEGRDASLPGRPCLAARAVEAWLGTDPASGSPPQRERHF